MTIDPAIQAEFPDLARALESFIRARNDLPSTTQPQPDPDHVEREAFRQWWIAFRRSQDNV